MRPDSARGVSSVVGVVLLLGITLLGTGAIVTLGAQAFADTERSATISQAEHSLTQFDSKAAVVALGESQSQRVDLGSSGKGEFVSENESGWIRVIHQNATGSGENETVYNASLGSVSYRNGDTEVGYQGGGVWERRGNGSVMRSPPEFNYRGSTLTLPVIRVTSEQQATGRTTAIVTQASESRRVFPNDTKDSTETWADEGAPYGDNTTYANPVVSGNVTVTVQSRFYKGWAEFFRTRTTGDVSVDHGRNTATVELVTTDTVGTFILADAMDENGVTARGQAEGHSLTDFNFTFVSDGGNDFNNHYAGFYAESGPHRFEYVVHVPQGSPEHLELRMFYRNTDTNVQHEWKNTSIPIDSGPIRLDESGDETKLIVNLTAGNATHGVNLTYAEVTEPGETYYDWSGNANETITFDSGHTKDNEPRTFDQGADYPSETTTYHLSRHYIALMGDEFTISARSSTGGSGGGSQLNLDASTGTLDYESGTGGSYITYLHITENEVAVELE